MPASGAECHRGTKSNVQSKTQLEQICRSADLPPQWVAEELGTFLNHLESEMDLGWEAPQKGKLDF